MKVPLDRQGAGDVGGEEGVDLDAGVEQDEVAVGDVAGVADPVQRVGVVAGGADRVVADAVALVAGVQAEDALDPALAATELDGRLELGDDRLEADVGGGDGLAHLLDLVLVLDHPQQREGVGEGVVLLGERLLLGAVLDAGGVEAGGQLAVGVAHEAHGDLAGVLGGGVLELVDVARGEAELELDVGQARAGADPELAVAGVGEELVAVALAERAEVEDRLVAVVGRLEHEHRVRLAVGAEAGEVGERAVRAEDVVGVVAAHLEPAGGHDEPLPREGGADDGAALRGIRGRRRPGSVACGRRSAQSSRTKPRNSSVVGRARFSACFCSSLTRLWWHACPPTTGSPSVTACATTSAARTEHLYGVLVRALADDWDRGGVVRDLLAGHEDAPAGDMVQLRLLAGIHRVVLRGDAPELARFYPSVGGTADRYAVWPALEPVLRAHADELRAALDVAPQTNEVGRSVALLAGLSEAVRRTGLTRVRLLEPGASAGLNLLVDRFRFVGDGWAAGPADAHLVLDGCGAAGFAPAAFEVVERRGCDLHPIDVADPDAEAYLRSFIWPHMPERDGRLVAALATAARAPGGGRPGGRRGVGAGAAGGSPSPTGCSPWCGTRSRGSTGRREEYAAMLAAVDEARSRMPVVRVALEDPDPLPTTGTWLPQVEVDDDVIGHCTHHGPPLDAR